jgi:hypothetical protein
MLVGGDFALQQRVLERLDVVGRGAFDHGLERLRQLGAFAGLGVGDDVVDGFDLRIARGGRAVLDDEVLDAAGGARRRDVAGGGRRSGFGFSGLAAGLAGGSWAWRFRVGRGFRGHSGLLGVLSSNSCISSQRDSAASIFCVNWLWRRVRSSSRRLSAPA